MKSNILLEIQCIALNTFPHVDLNETLGSLFIGLENGNTYKISLLQNLDFILVIEKSNIESEIWTVLEVIETKVLNINKDIFEKII